MKIIFLIDFDGTITKVDTVELMIKNFAKDGWQYYEHLWENGQISTEECAINTLKLMSVSEYKLLSLLNTVQIDDYFISFLDFCKKNNLEAVIVSDGYDFNIKAIMKKYNFYIDYFSNRLWFENDSIKVEFTYKNKECDKCGMCKLNILQKYKDKGYKVFYIGDGYSDFCVSDYADIVFAKGVLKKYCEEKNIKFFSFHNFNDIIKKIEAINLY